MINIKGHLKVLFLNQVVFFTAELWGANEWCKMKTEGHKDKSLNREDCSIGSIPECIYPVLLKRILRTHIVYTQKAKLEHPISLHFSFKFNFFFSCIYICDFLGGVLLLENPKGDNRLDLLKLKSVVTSIFGMNDIELAVFHGETGMWEVAGHPWPLTQGGMVNMVI